MMDSEELEKIANRIAQENALVAFQSIKYNESIIGRQVAIGIAIASTKMTLAIILTNVFNLTSEQQQFFYDKLGIFVNETIESIKSAPSEN